jgi:hypothetical protein
VPTPPPATPATTPPAEPNGGNNPPPGSDTGSKHTNLLSPPANMTPVIIGLAAAGVGLAGAIIFAAFKADSQTKADSVAREIRDAAVKRGYDGDKNGVPDAKGVCTDTTPSIQKDFSNACATLQQNNDKVDTNATIANISLVVLGVGAVTAIGWYLFAPKRDDQGSSSSSGAIKPAAPVLAPYAGYNNGGFVLSGQF